MVESLRNTCIKTKESDVEHVFVKCECFKLNAFDLYILSCRHTYHSDIGPYGAIILKDG